MVANTNITPNGSKVFLDYFSQRNLMRIRDYVVNVEHVDDYTGMIKYNCGGRGLSVGIRGQVQQLVELLGLVRGLRRVRVCLIDGAITRVRFPSGRVHRVQDERNFESSQMVLEPLRSLYNVRWVEVTGVSEEYREDLERSMMSPRVG
jgi:hypothetical protein